jgi:squalene-associated FAD-dependent desaturase
MSIRPGRQRKVAILGAGAAGLSSALIHHENGYKVTIIEASHRLGGRAWARPHDSLDNGPHVLLGCYRAFRRLLRAIDAEKGFDQRPSLELSYLLRGGRMLRLRTSRYLPAPLHLLAGLAQIEGLGISGGLDLCFGAFAGAALRARRGETLAEWIQRRGIGEWSQRLYLQPLCRAVMNAEPQDADARLLLSTLLEAFSGNHAHSAIWVPKRSWHALLHEPAARWAERCGMHLRLGARVEALTQGEDAPIILLGNGERLEGFDRVVVATDWRAASELLEGMPEARKLAQIESSPIVTVHFDIPERELGFSDPIVALVDGAPFHFICRRSAGDGKARPRTPVSLLAGAADSLDGMNAGQIIQAAATQLQAWTGREHPLSEQALASARVIRENGATMMPNPGLDALRPEPGPSSRRGLWLAGDWCQTQLPSTLEGAARSAFLPFDRGQAGQ